MGRNELIKKGTYLIGGAPRSQASTASSRERMQPLDTLAEIKQVKAEREVKDKAEWNRLCNWCW